MSDHVHQVAAARILSLQSCSCARAGKCAWAGVVWDRAGPALRGRVRRLPPLVAPAPHETRQDNPVPWCASPQPSASSTKPPPPRLRVALPDALHEVGLGQLHRLAARLKPGPRTGCGGGGKVQGQAGPGAGARARRQASEGRLQGERRTRARPPAPRPPQPAVRRPARGTEPGPRRAPGLGVRDGGLVGVLRRKHVGEARHVCGAPAAAALQQQRHLPRQPALLAQTRVVVLGG
jgi:hypothetical protein